MSMEDEKCTIGVNVSLTNKDGNLTVGEATLQDNEAIKKCMGTGDGENKGQEVKSEDTKGEKKAQAGTGTGDGENKGRKVTGGKRRRKSRGGKHGGRKSKRRSSKKARKSKKSKRRRGKKSKRRRRRK
jgi:hypothetical protein